MTHALVTGGAGFIGSHLVEALLARNDEVSVVDNLSTGRRANLSSLQGGIRFLEGDVRDLDLLTRAMRGVDVVFHLAALPSVPHSVAHPLECHEVLATGTLKVLLAARDAGVRRVVIASSSAVYGEQPEQPKVETMRPAPVSPYAVGKVMAEMHARTFTELYGLSTACLRYFNVFGPRQDPCSQYAGVIAKFCACAAEGLAFPVDGDGEQSRDFIYVDNVVQANLAAAAAMLPEALVANIGHGTGTTLNQIATTLSELSGRPCVISSGPTRVGDVRHSRAEISLARQALGFDPTVSVQEGLKRTLRSCLGA